MAKQQYGTPIAPTVGIEKVIEEMAEHLNWPKGKVVGYCATECRDKVMTLPRAPRFSEDESYSS